MWIERKRVPHTPSELYLQMALSSWNFPFCVPAVEVCSALHTGNAKTKPTMNNSTFVPNIPIVSFEISLSPFTDSIFCWLFLIFKRQPARNWQQLWDNCFFSSPSCRGKKKKKKEFKEIACVKQWSLNCRLHIFGKHESQNHRMAWTGGDLKEQLHLSLFSPPLWALKSHGQRKITLLLQRGDTMVRCPSSLCKWSEVMLHLHDAQGTWISVKEEEGMRMNRLRHGSQTSRNHSLHSREGKSCHRDLYHLRLHG